jgi:hypothetical protein
VLLRSSLCARMTFTHVSRSVANARPHICRRASPPHTKVCWCVQRHALLLCVAVLSSSKLVTQRVLHPVVHRRVLHHLCCWRVHWTAAPVCNSKASDGCCMRTRRAVCCSARKHGYGRLSTGGSAKSCASQRRGLHCLLPTRARVSCPCRVARCPPALWLSPGTHWQPQEPHRRCALERARAPG